MAIYNNRQVSILGPNSMANSPETINVQHTNGSHENVDVSLVYFTQAEKDNLVKKYPSKFNDVKVASADDVEAVQTGVAPSYDPSYAEATKAKAKAQADKQAEILKKNTDLAKKNSETTPVSTPSSTPAPETPTPVNVPGTYSIPNQTVSN